MGRPETRPETIAGIDLQRATKNTPAKELHAGHTHNKQIERSAIFREQGPQLAKLEELIRTLDRIFKTTLPNEWKSQNTPKSRKERLKELRHSNKKFPNYGGIPMRFRVMLSCFSNLTLLKSCPAAVHKDQNGSGKIPNFSCLTSVGEGFKGGRFCFIEYGLEVPVTPGDILICQSTREWHTNIGAVEGLKYSIVAYYKRPLVSPRFRYGSSMPKETDEQRRIDELVAMGPAERANLIVRGLSGLTPHKQLLLLQGLSKLKAKRGR